MTHAYFVKPDIITEIRISVQLWVAAVGGPFPFNITAKDVDNAVLNFRRYLREIHILAAAGRAFHLEVIPVVLVKPLETFDEQEVDRKPCQSVSPCARNVTWSSQIGPRQLELPPNIPE